ncbi:MAG: FAD-binding oxidoreductase [Chloroflexi bacterium]|nr:FAD-binding oxidoreductase [Chloroflexota bacterium]
MRPATADELAAALHEADEHVQAVTPVGGGTQLDLGMPPARVDVLLETTALDRVVEYEPADLTVTVEAGMRFDALQRLLGENGQFLALDPPALEGATIGGLIATNASGPLRFSYGGPRDLVIGTRVANPDGTLTRAGGRVVKNVAGYDLNKLYIGSLGTLAVIVELSFKLAPIPPAAATIVGAFSSPDAAGSAVSAVLRSPLAPLAIELLNGQAARGASIGSSVHLALRVGGYPQAVERQVRDLRRLVEDHAGRPVDAAESAWDDLARMRVDALQREVVLKAAAPIAHSAALVGLLEQRLAEFDPIVWAHAGNGVAYAACSEGISAQALVALRDAVQQLGSNASLVVQRCPTVLKHEVDVWGDAGGALALMRAIKARLDPRNTLNPGRYVGGI